MTDQIKHPGTPRVDACIEAVSKRYPSLKSTAYYEEVHQHIAPLARDMEREIADLRAALQAQQGDALRDAVLEEAATRCDCLTANRRPVYARDCVDAIRAMKSDAALAARREG